MSEVQDYRSRLGDPESRRYGTFSYLPTMTPAQIRKQVDFIVSRGWNPAIEHSERENASGHYWYMWKLPMFGERDTEKILAEAEACHLANPGNLVRLVGYDNDAQSQGAAMVIYRDEESG